MRIVEKNNLEQVINMVRDNVIEEILRKTQEGLKAKYGIEFTTDEIYNMVNSQFEYIPVAMQNKETVKLNYLGKFTIKSGREDAVNTNNEMAESYLDDDRKKEIIKARAYKAKNVILDFRQNKE